MGLSGKTSSIPVSVETYPQIKENPMQHWANNESGILDEKLTYIEKEMFRGICLMLISLWDTAYVQDTTQRESKFAEFLSKKQKDLVSDFFNSEVNLNKFKKTILDSYREYRVKSTKSSSSKEEESIISSAVDSLNTALKLVQEEVNEVLKSIREELSGTKTQSSSSNTSTKNPKDIVDNTDNPAALLENNVKILTKDLNSFSTEINQLKSIVGKDKDSPEVQKFLERINSYKKSDLSVGNAISIVSSKSQIENLKKVGIQISKYQQFNLMGQVFANQAKDLFSELNGSKTITDLISGFTRFQNKDLSNKQIQEKVKERLSKLPKSIQTISKIDFVSITKDLTSPILALGIQTISLGLNIGTKILSTVGKYSKKFFLGIFSKISSLINKLSNWFFDYISNPFNAFKFGLIGTLLVKSVSKFLTSNNEMIKKIRNFSKAFIVVGFEYAKNWIKTQINKLRKKYSSIDKVVGFFENFSDKIKNNAFTKGLYEKVSGLIVGKNGIYTKLKGDYSSKNLEYRDKQKEAGTPEDKIKNLSVGKYIFDPKLMVTSIVKWMKDAYDGSTFQKIVNGLVSFVVGIPEWVVKSVEWVCNVVSFINNNPLLKNFLLSVVDLLISPSGAIAQVVATMALPYSLLALPLYLMGNTMMRMLENANNVISVSDKYKKLFGNEIDDDYLTSLKFYSNKIKDSGIDEKQFQGQYQSVFAKIIAEQQSLDSLISGFNSFQNLIRSGKFEINNFQGGYLTEILPNMANELVTSYLFGGIKIADMPYYDKDSPGGINNLVSQIKNILNARSALLNYFLIPLGSGLFSISEIKKMSEDKNLFLDLGKALNGNILDPTNRSSFDAKYKELFKEVNFDTSSIVFDIENIFKTVTTGRGMTYNTWDKKTSTNNFTSNTHGFTQEQIKSYRDLPSILLPFINPINLKKGTNKNSMSALGFDEQELQRMSSHLQQLTPQQAVELFANKDLDEVLLDLFEEFGGDQENSKIRIKRLEYIKSILSDTEKHTEFTQVRSEENKHKNEVLKKLNNFDTVRTNAKLLRLILAEIEFLKNRDFYLEQYRHMSSEREIVNTIAKDLSTSEIPIKRHQQPPAWSYRGDSRNAVPSMIQYAQ